MAGFKCVPGGELTLAASAIAIAIAKEVEDDDELNILANLILAIGGNLAMIAAQRAVCPPPNCRDSLPPLL